MARTAVVTALTKRLTAAAQPLRAATDPDSEHSDFRFYRKVGGHAGRRDQTEHVREESIRRAFDFCDYHPIASRYVSLMREWVAGGEYRVLSDNERVQEILDAFWTDPRNDWDSMLPKYVGVRVVAGELFLPAKVDMGTGRVVLDYWDPADVAGVKMREGSQRIIDAVLYNIPGSTLKLEVPVVRAREMNMGAPTFGLLVGADPRGGVEGLSGVLAWQWNAPPNATRGRSDFLASMDYWSTLDDFHAAEAERAQMLARFMGHVTVQGGDGEVAKIQNALGEREPWYASLPVVTDTVSMQLGSPSTGAADSDQRERMLRRYASAPTGIPPHILVGDIEAGGTRAVATAANDPAWLHGKAIQQDMVRVIETCCQYQLDTLKLVNPSALSGVPEDEQVFRVETPALLRPDPVQAAPVLAQVTISLIQAVGDKLLDRKTARRVYAQMLSEVGVRDVELADIEEALEAEPDVSQETRDAFAEARRELEEAEVA